MYGRLSREEQAFRDLGFYKYVMPFITDYDIHDMPHSLKFDTSGKQRNFSEINTIQKLGWLVDYAYDHTPLMVQRSHSMTPPVAHQQMSNRTRRR